MEQLSTIPYISNYFLTFVSPIALTRLVVNKAWYKLIWDIIGKWPLNERYFVIAARAGLARYIRKLHPKWPMSFIVHGFREACWTQNIKAVDYFLQVLAVTKASDVWPQWATSVIMKFQKYIAFIKNKNTYTRYQKVLEDTGMIKYNEFYQCKAAILRDDADIIIKNYAEWRTITHNKVLAYVIKHDSPKSYRCFMTSRMKIPASTLRYFGRVRDSITSAHSKHPLGPKCLAEFNDIYPTKKLKQTDLTTRQHNLLLHLIQNTIISGKVDILYQYATPDQIYQILCNIPARTDVEHDSKDADICKVALLSPQFKQLLPDDHGVSRTLADPMKIIHSNYLKTILQTCSKSLVLTILDTLEAYYSVDAEHRDIIWFRDIITGLIQNRSISFNDKIMLASAFIIKIGPLVGTYITWIAALIGGICASHEFSKCEEINSLIMSQLIALDVLTHDSAGAYYGHDTICGIVTSSNTYMMRLILENNDYIANNASKILSLACEHYKPNIIYMLSTKVDISIITCSACEKNGQRHMPIIGAL